MLNSVKDILVFWFGQEYLEDSLRSSDYIKSRLPYWFGTTHEDFIAQQRENSSLFDVCNSKDKLLLFVQKDDVNAKELSCKDLLAAIIVLDQFARAVYRGTAKAFSFEETAVQLAKEIVDKGWYYSKLCAAERLFVHLPFAHSEDIAMQEIGVEIGNNIGRGESQSVIDFFEGLRNTGFPDEHYKVLKRFGRFPSRNHALGRETTLEEAEWLESPDCPGWAKSQMRA